MAKHLTLPTPDQIRLYMYCRNIAHYNRTLMALPFGMLHSFCEQQGIATHA